MEYNVPLLYLPFFTIWVSAIEQASHTLKLSTAWVSATKQASHTLKLFIAWVSATKQASHTLKLFIAWVSAEKQASHTLKLFIAWVSATKQASHTLKLFIAWVSAEKQASYTLKFFIAWVSAEKQASHPHKLFTLRRKNGTEKFLPVSCAHAVAEEGYRLACSYLLYPRRGARRNTRGTRLVYAPLRYEPCTQFINVSQKARHIYWQFSAMSPCNLPFILCRHLTAPAHFQKHSPADTGYSAPPRESEYPFFVPRR